MEANNIVGLIMSIFMSFLMNIFLMNWICFSFFDRVKYLHIRHKNDKTPHISTRIYYALHLDKCKREKCLFITDDDELGYDWGFQKENPKWFKITQLIIILSNMIGSIILSFILVCAFIYMLCKGIYYGSKYLWKEIKIWVNYNEEND